MGGIMDFIGVHGFLGNLSANDEVNSAEAEWRGFVSLWWAAFRDSEVTIKELYELAMEGEVLSGVMGEGQEHVATDQARTGTGKSGRSGLGWEEDRHPQR